MGSYCSFIFLHGTILIWNIPNATWSLIAFWIIHVAFSDLPSWLPRSTCWPPPAYVIIVHIIDLNYHDSISAYLFIPLLLIYHTNCLSIPQNTWEERKGLLFLSRFSGTLDLLDTGRRSCVPSSVHIGCLCQDLLALLASCFPFCEGDVGTSSHKEVWAPQEVTIITLPGGNTHTAAHIKLGFILRPEK